MNIPADITTAAAAWAADPTLTLLDAIATGPAAKAVSVPRMMWVPPTYVPLFMSRRLTPRQLVDEVLAVVTANGHEAAFEPFVNWCLAAGTAFANGDVASPVLAAADVGVPVGDANFLFWRQQLLQNMLPSLVGTGSAATSAATVRIAGLMGDLLREQQAARGDASAARTAAAQPKTVGEYYKAHVTAKLMAMCNVTIETNLPKLWHELAAANGKREREVIEENIRQIASHEGIPELAPVVTPTLAKKITALRFSGTNLDDLSEGINPFALVIMDHTTASGSLAYNEALMAAHDYDDLMRGSGSADLSDLKSIKASVKVLIPETYALGRAMLQAYRLVLISLLGEEHAEVCHYNNFLTAYTNRENFYMGRLQQADPKWGAARLLRYVQLVMRAWFDAIWNTNAGAVGVPSPDFQGPLNKMMVGDMTWMPPLPEQYFLTPKVSDDNGSDKSSDGNKRASAKTKPLMVRNPTVNPRFEDFKMGIAKTKFNDAIKKVGTPPKVTRKGKATAMCASYHLRGSCFDNCGRKLDHGPHSEAEDNELYEWCKLAFE